MRGGALLRYLLRFEYNERTPGVDAIRKLAAALDVGTNLYLAKVCMDTIAKKAAPDKDGVRIAELNEDSYKFLLWDHRPLTDFWMLGPGKARTLEKACRFTMGDIAGRSQWDEEWFYKKFGIDGEILIAHAWGLDPVTMADVKSYHSDGHSLSNGQVLPRPYKYQEARNVLSEMIDSLCTDIVRQGCGRAEIHMVGVLRLQKPGGLSRL